jgi:hypothetical protein
MAFPTGWTKKCPLVIDNTKVSGTSNLTNFVVLLTEANFPSTAFDHSLDGGADLRFTSDADGTTELAFEVVTWNTSTDKAQVWVKVPTVDYDDDTTFYVWYGNATATAYAADDTYGSNACWDVYDVVAHMEEDPASATVASDSSPNAYDFGEYGTVATAGGKIGNSINFDGSTGKYYRLLSDSPALDTTASFTISAWFNTDNDRSWRMIYQSGYDTNAKNIRLIQHVDGRTFVNCEGVTTAAMISTTYNTAGNWTYVFFSWDASTKKTILNYNGAKEWDTDYESGARANLSTTGHGGGSTPVQIGSQYVSGGFTNYWYGELDEIHVLDGTARTSDWGLTEYNNQNSPATFVIEGTEEDVGGSVTGPFPTFFRA